MLYEFHSKKMQLKQPIRFVYGDLTLEISGDLNLNEKDRPGRPIEANDYLFEELHGQSTID